MVQVNSKLVRQAIDILRSNNRGSFTVPTHRLYPFQWNWDSAFISMGLAYFDVDAALTELESLARGQWLNGMIPHIIFHSENETTYFPNWDFWDAAVNDGAPVSPKTSGITQPPVFAIALLRIFEMHGANPIVLERVRRLYEHALRFQRFWYNARDPKGEGLVAIIHPWESGRDNSPVWDAALENIELERASIPVYQRRDVTIADASERPTNKQYDQYVYLLKLAHSFGYDDPGLLARSEFVLQDCMINALLIRSNSALIQLGAALDISTTEVEDWNRKSSIAFNDKLWSDKLNVYCSFDVQNSVLVETEEVGGYASLFSGVVSKERTERMAGKLIQLSGQGYLLVPSFDPSADGFDPKRYWRGPVWPQMNLLVYRGLVECGYDDLAARAKGDILDLIEACGFREYFDPRKELLKTGNSGYGGDNFSWTASTFLELIHGE